ncbi:hypothetical protein [Qingshengfaniella alkalisoli]|uniref:Uncharacterized protein n=1 Tax=Qingshengfaniella alkalisoli TaxID=2599296 RepID=A0A5B8J7W0_9RHOB|nr:hypothetical protein [Qingshengfaniella alkalisoli]QDY70567.1 hypothetical protein FPZ52_12765 [Qingshengfaniella alkalisoli]
MTTKKNPPTSELRSDELAASDNASVFSDSNRIGRVSGSFGNVGATSAVGMGLLMQSATLEGQMALAASVAVPDDFMQPNVEPADETQFDPQVQSATTSQEESEAGAQQSQSAAHDAQSDPDSTTTIVFGPAGTARSGTIGASTPDPAASPSHDSDVEQIAASEHQGPAPTASAAMGTTGAAIGGISLSDLDARSGNTVSAVPEPQLSEHANLTPDSIDPLPTDTAGSLPEPSGDLLGAVVDDGGLLDGLTGEDGVVNGVVGGLVGEDGLVANIGTDGLLQPILGTGGALDTILGDSGLLGNIVGEDSVLDSVLGADGILGSGSDVLLDPLIGENGAVDNLIGGDGVVSGLLGAEGVLNGGGLEAVLDPVLGDEGLLSNVAGGDGVLGSVAGDEGITYSLLDPVLGEDALLGDAGTAVLDGLAGDGGILDDLVGNDGLVDGLVGDDGLLDGGGISAVLDPVIGEDGILNDVLGGDGLIAGLFDNDSGLLSGAAESGGLLGGLGLLSSSDSVATDVSTPTASTTSDAGGMNEDIGSADDGLLDSLLGSEPDTVLGGLLGDGDPFGISVSEDDASSPASPEDDLFAGLFGTDALTGTLANQGLLENAASTLTAEADHEVDQLLTSILNTSGGDALGGDNAFNALLSDSNDADMFAETELDSALDTLFSDVGDAGASLLDAIETVSSDDEIG